MNDICIICILLYIGLYGVKGSSRNWHTYLAYIAMSKLRSMEGNSMLLDQEVHVCGIYSG